MVNINIDGWFQFKSEPSTKELKKLLGPIADAFGIGSWGMSGPTIHFAGSLPDGKSADDGMKQIVSAIKPGALLQAEVRFATDDFSVLCPIQGQKTWRLIFLPGEQKWIRQRGRLSYQGRTEFRTKKGEF